MEKEIRLYYIEIDEKVMKEINKLDKQLKKRCLRKIRQLTENPAPTNKKDILKIVGRYMLCKLSVDKIRIYYEVGRGHVIIKSIGYDGRVNVNYLYNQVIRITQINREIL